MRLTFVAELGAPKFSIDAHALNAELTSALGGWCNGWSASHNAHEAIVDLAPEREGDEALVRQVVEAHIANTEIRNARKAIDEQIAALENSITPRTLREAALGSPGRLRALDNQIAALRAQRS